MKWQWPGLAHRDGAWGWGSWQGTFLPPPPDWRDWPALFPFIVTGSPRNSMWCSLIGQSLENYATVARQNFVNHFLMEMWRALAFNVKKRINLKPFCCFWCCRKGFIKSIKGGTSCSIGEAKGGVKAWRWRWLQKFPAKIKVVIKCLLQWFYDFWATHALINLWNNNYALLLSLLVAQCCCCRKFSESLYLATPSHYNAHVPIWYIILITINN